MVCMHLYDLAAQIAVDVGVIFLKIFLIFLKIFLRLVVLGNELLVWFGCTCSYPTFLILATSEYSCARKPCLYVLVA